MTQHGKRHRNICVQAVEHDKELTLPGTHSLSIIHSWLMMASRPSIAYADLKTAAACRQADSALFLRVSNISCRSPKRGSRSFYQRRGRRRRNAGPQPRRARSRPTKGKAVIPVLLLDSG